jgi:cytochrome P450
VTAALQDLTHDMAGYLADTSSVRDPYPMFRALREQAPVCWVPEASMWVVTGFEQAEEFYRVPGLSREAAAERQFAWLARPEDPPLVQQAVHAWRSTILNLEPPDHTRLRSLITATFTPKAVKRWKDRTEGIVTELLGRVPDGEFDALQVLAYPLPETVICEVLGVPVEDHALWKIWSAGFGTAAVMVGRRSADEALPEHVLAEAHQTLLKQYGYFSDLVERRRREPGEDLVTDLVRVEEDGERMSHDELVGGIILLVGAGHETTANLVANGMLALAHNPAEYDALRADPSLAAAVVEETLRYDGPTRGQPKAAVQDVVLGGEQVRAGDMVMVFVNAANRDPAAFDGAEEFRLAHASKRHLAFGGGIHYCVGAALARMEAEVFFRQLGQLDRRLELSGVAFEELTYKPTHGRNLTALPMRLA